MLRATFNIAAALSLLLACAILAAWAWGRTTPRAFEFAHKGTLWQVVSDSGRLRIDNEPQRRLAAEPARRAERTYHRIAERVNPWREDLSGPEHLPKRAELYRAVVHWHFYVQREQVPPAVVVVTPLLKPLVISAALPASWLSFTTFNLACRQWRRKRGLCPVCAYDLRATPGRCPECGSTTAAAIPIERYNAVR